MPAPLLWLGACFWLGLFGGALLLSAFVTVYYLNNKHWELMTCYLLAAVDVILLITAIYGASLVPRG
ncbi:MAG: hypothetical protein M5U01_12080 [Ardenticatenaceae bacterium]|nr:hypothetical protein [Ardenticatenaceae bacterium]HBY99545.1 hypothetical protein [Chloroflexota bacterium]